MKLVTIEVRLQYADSGTCPGLCYLKVAEKGEKIHCEVTTAQESSRRID